MLPSRWRTALLIFPNLPPQRREDHDHQTLPVCIRAPFVENLLWYQIHLANQGGRRHSSTSTEKTWTWPITIVLNNESQERKVFFTHHQLPNNYTGIFKYDMEVNGNGNLKYDMMMLGRDYWCKGSNRKFVENFGSYRF